MNTSIYTFPENRDLGEPLPNATHAISVSLPEWRDVVGYEENEPRVINSLKAGYPRFVYHPIVQDLINSYKNTYARQDETCLIFPSKRYAELCADYIKLHTEITATLHTDNKHNVHIVCYPQSAHEIAHQFWQHAGAGINSRQAEDILNDTLAPSDDQAKLEQTICQRIAELNDSSPENTFLFPSGMNAFFEAHQLLTKLKPNAKTIQLGFPYVDSLKIQQRFGVEYYLIADNNVERLNDIITTEPIAAVFCELPSNPELKTIDLIKLSALLKKHNIPLVVDDTISNFQLDIAHHADIIITSLTKAFSGACDVLAGALTTNQNSPIYETFKPALSSQSQHIYIKDLETLNTNSKDVKYRIKSYSQNTDIIIKFLKTKIDIIDIFHPTTTDTALYNALKKPQGGYGGLFSISFKNPDNAAPFYDALRLCKGPSLGTNFTLACPYVLLAHYFEQAEVKKYGIDPYLIRIAIGLESPQEIIADLEQAFNAIS